MGLPITVVVPYGPHHLYGEFLESFLDSVWSQTAVPDQILIIDDCQSLPDVPHVDVYTMPWPAGCAVGWNFGVALARNDCVFMAGSDDIMYPECLESCYESYKEHQQKAAWYNVTIEDDHGDIHWIPNNAAMVTKLLWTITGGFPPSAGVGGPDALLLSILMTYMPDRIVQVRQDTPLYRVRSHPHQDTGRQASFFLDEMGSVRNKETARWKGVWWTP